VAGKLTDAHTHLDRIPGRDLPAVLERARDAGVAWIVTAGMDLPSSRRAISLARTHDGVLASVGVHPWVAADGLPAGTSDALAGLAAQARVVAIAEVGLDFVGNAFTGQSYETAIAVRRAQEEALRVQIGVAREVGLPLVVHCRGAYKRLLEILAEEKATHVGGVVHNADVDPATARRLLDFGFLLSFGGAITHPDARAVRGLAGRLPLDGILLETDAPYMSLRGEEDGRNEPARVARVAEALARCAGVKTGRLVEASFANFTRRFLPGAPSDPLAGRST
jgi:TatD DNase family protein